MDKKQPYPDRIGKMLERKRYGDMPRCPIEGRRQTSGKSLQCLDKLVGAVACVFSTSETEAAK